MWLDSWSTKVMADRRVLIGELWEALGRMAFVYGALVWDKSFLGPLVHFPRPVVLSAFVEFALFVG